MTVRSNQSHALTKPFGGFDKQRIVKFVDIILIEQRGVEAGSTRLASESTMVDCPLYK